MALIISLIYTFISTLNAQPPEAICVWGRSKINLPGRETNGLYRLATEQANGAPYWKLDMTGQDCPMIYHWLYWYDAYISAAGWYIGYSSTQDFAFSIDGLLSAKCTNGAATKGQGPQACGNNWAYLNDYDTQYWDTIDPAVNVTAGPCPSLNCAQIDASHSESGGCKGTFLQTGDNHYTESGTGDIWWFNVPLFQWQCNTGAANAEQTCDYSNTGKLGTELVQAINVQTWKGETGTMVYTGGRCNCYTGTRDITLDCQGGDGTSPAFNNGTYLPTTPNPTAGEFPTPRPTVKTWAPTVNPTAMTPAPNTPTQPTAPTIPPPTAPTIPQPTAPTRTETIYEGDAKDSGEGESMIAGLDDTWLWVIIIILIIILCCCCICCLWYYRKKKKTNSNQYFGDQDDDRL